MSHDYKDHDKTFLNDKNDLVERLARYYMLDAVACTRLAKITMEAILALMSRMSSRCIRISQAVNTIIKAEKLHEEYERIKSLPGRPG